MSFPPPDPSRPARNDLPPPGAAPFPPPAVPPPASEVPDPEPAPGAAEPLATAGEPAPALAADAPDPEPAADADPEPLPTEPESLGAGAEPTDPEPLPTEPESLGAGAEPTDPEPLPDEPESLGAAPEVEPVAAETETEAEAAGSVSAEAGPDSSPDDGGEVLTPDAVIDEGGAEPAERVEPSATVMQPASTLPAATTSRALVPIPKAEEPPVHRGLAKRWSLPAWAWLALGTVVVAGGVAAVVTRPDDDSQEVATLQNELASKEAELVQVQVDAQQKAFEDVQEVRDEAEQQLSAAADAREQAEEAADLSDARYAELVEYQIGVTQDAANRAACDAGDEAGYAQEAKPDPAKFAPAAVADLPGDTRAAVLARLDTAAIKEQVDTCFQNGTNRYLSQTTTTTTTTTAPPPPPADPNAPPPG